MIVLEFRPDDEAIVSGDKVLHHSEILTASDYDSWFTKWNFKEKDVAPVDYDKNCRRVKAHVYPTKLSLEQLRKQSTDSKFAIMDRPEVGDTEEVYVIGPQTGIIYPCVVTEITNEGAQGYIKGDDSRDIVWLPIVFKLISDPDKILLNSQE